MKLKKVMNGLLSAMLCATMTLTLAVPASAEDLRTDENVEFVAESAEEIELEEDADIAMEMDDDLSSEETTDSSSVEEIVSETAVELAVSEGKYLKELRIASAGSEAEAKKILKNAGYSVIDQNVNKDADVLFSDARAVYIGYQTTSNITEAVRDITVMNMGGNYMITDAETTIADQLTAYQYVEDEHYVMLQEFRENYAAGAPLAKTAYEALNCFREDDSGMLLGDYLLQIDLTPSTRNDISDFFVFFSTISADALTLIDTWLAYGLATYGRTNFLSRIGAMTDEEIRDAKENRVNISNAEMLLPYVQTYAAAMNELDERIEEADLEEELEGDLDDLSEETSYLVMRDSYFQYLEEFWYDDGTLEDLILSDDLTAEDLTLLASQMSDAQRYAVKYVGFAQILQQEAADSGSWTPEDEQEKLQDMMEDQMNDVIDQVTRKAKEYGELSEEGEPLSIYYGVDRDTVEGTIAVTTDALHRMDATSDYSYLTQDDSAFLRGLKVGMLAAGIVGVTLTLFGSMMVYRGEEVVVKEATVVNNAIDQLAAESWFDLTSQDASSFAQKFVEEDQLFGNRVMIAGTTWAKVILGGGLLLLMLMFSGFYVYSEYQEKHKVFNKSNIPDVIIDMRTTESGVPYYVRYYSVKEFTSTDGELDPGDVNGYVGDQWNILYTTTNVDAGEPVQADFRIARNKAVPKSGELGIHTFGSTTEANLNAYTYNEDNAPKIYVYAKIGVVNGLLGTIFSGTNGYVVMLIFGILLGAALMTLLSVLYRRRGKSRKSA